MVNLLQCTLHSLLRTEMVGKVGLLSTALTLFTFPSQTTLPYQFLSMLTVSTQNLLSISPTPDPFLPLIPFFHSLPSRGGCIVDGGGVSFMGPRILLPLFMSRWV